MSVGRSGRSPVTPHGHVRAGPAVNPARARQLLREPAASLPGVRASQIWCREGEVGPVASRPCDERLPARA